MTTADTHRTRRLPKAERHRQLLDTALLIVREEGADRLTLGHLAARAGVSKPVAYEHFTTRSGLLIELYRWIDTERVGAFRAAMENGERSRREAIAALAKVYIDCASNLTDEFHAVGAALAGSEDKAAVLAELVDNVVEMFVAVLRPFASTGSAELVRICVGLVGAGDALSAAVIRGRCTAAQASNTLGVIIENAVPPDGAGR